MIDIIRPGYEQATGKVIAAGNNPFTDTTDINAIKAAAIGVTTGTSATTFSSSALLTREYDTLESVVLSVRS